MSEVDKPERADLASDDEGGKLKKAEFDEKLDAERRAQNLPEGAVPEQRPIASQKASHPHSRVYDALVEAGDPRAGNSGDPNVGWKPTQEDYERTASAAQARQSDKESLKVVRLYPGARCWVDNPGQPDHGRAVAVNRVQEFEDVANELLAGAGTDQSRNAMVKSYECVSRDGRSEFMIISAEHLRVAPVEAEWGKTPLFATPTGE